MLFSRKNAAIVAAFLSSTAYAQTAAVASQSLLACNSTGQTVFEIGGNAGGGGTQGPLNIFVTVDTTTTCTNGGFPITLVSGTYTGSNVPNAGGAISLASTTAGAVAADNCFQPCQANDYQKVTTAGFNFAQAPASGAGAAVVYRLYQNTNALALSTNPTTASGNTATTQTVAGLTAINACRAPSPGAAICAAQATLTCAATTRNFYTFTGTDGVNNFVGNVGFNPSATCGTNGLANSNSGGFQVTSFSGTYLGLPLQLTTGTTYCFYPCAAVQLDTTGISFNTYDVTQATQVGGPYIIRATGSATGSGYTVNGQTGTTGSFAQSCMSSQAAYYRACASSSTSSIMSSTSSGLIASPSVSLPVTLPSVSLSGSVTPSVSISGVVTPTGSVSGSASNVVTIATGATSGAASITGGSSGVVTVPTTTPTSATSGAVSATSTGPETSVATPFVITVTVRASRRRQAVEYVGSGGVLTTDPNQAAQFQLLDGQLFSNGVIVSTGPQIPAQQPLAGGVQGTVSTVWSSTNGAIAWTNAVFANGAASFCVENNVVNTVFVAAPATGCTPVALTNTPLSAVIVASPSASGAAAAGGITINNNFSPVIGVTVTVNLVLGSATLSNGTVITTTGLSSATEPLYATASNGLCVPCHLSSAGVACPSSGVVVYQTACSACAAYATPSAAIVPCPTCAPVAVATAGAAAAAGATAGAAAGAAGAGAAAGAAATAAAAAAATAGKNVFTGGAATYGVEAAAIVAAGAALLL